MSFPQTKHTLIQRIAAEGSDADWATFLTDYWGPVCRFAVRHGGLRIEEAEEVASVTFEALIRNNLLTRWVSNRSAKLRTLVCSVVRNVLSNRARILVGRERLLREKSARVLDAEVLSLLGANEPIEETEDIFYAAWADEIVQQGVEAVFETYRAETKEDYFRVLYGRLCEGMTSPEIARSLDLPVYAVENYFRHARNRLREQLKDLVRLNVERYCEADEVAGDFQAEWNRLGNYLMSHGGLDAAVRESYGIDPRHWLAHQHKKSSVRAAVRRLSGIHDLGCDRPSPADAPPHE